MFGIVFHTGNKIYKKILQANFTNILYNNRINKTRNTL